MTTTLREPIPRVRVAHERETLLAYAGGLTTREDAIENLGLRDHAELLVALGDVGLAPPRPSDEEVQAQAMIFERVWRAA